MSGCDRRTQLGTSTPSPRLPVTPGVLVGFLQDLAPGYHGQGPTPHYCGRHLSQAAGARDGGDRLEAMLWGGFGGETSANPDGNIPETTRDRESCGI